MSQLCGLTYDVGVRKQTCVECNGVCPELTSVQNHLESLTSGEQSMMWNGDNDNAFAKEVGQEDLTLGLGANYKAGFLSSSLRKRGVHSQVDWQDNLGGKGSCSLKLIKA